MIFKSDNIKRMWKLDGDVSKVFKSKTYLYEAHRIFVPFASVEAESESQAVELLLERGEITEQEASEYPNGKLFFKKIL